MIDAAKICTHDLRERGKDRATEFRMRALTVKFCGCWPIEMTDVKGDPSMVPSFVLDRPSNFLRPSISHTNRNETLFQFFIFLSSLPFRSFVFSRFLTATDSTLFPPHSFLTRAYAVKLVAFAVFPPPKKCVNVRKRARGIISKAASRRSTPGFFYTRVSSIPT